MPSIIQADQLKSADGNTTYLNSGTLSNLTFPDGHIVQVKCAYDTDQTAFTSSSTSQAITNLKCNITPKSASNTMFVHGIFYMGNNINYNGGFGLKRRLASASYSSSDTAIGSFTSQGISTDGSLRAQNFVAYDDPDSTNVYYLDVFPYGYIDSGYDTTSEITYQMTFASSNAQTYYYNHPSNGVSKGRGISTMYIFEIQGTVAIT